MATIEDKETLEFLYTEYQFAHMGSNEEIQMNAWRRLADFLRKSDLIHSLIHPWRPLDELADALVLGGQDIGLIDLWTSEGRVTDCYWYQGKYYQKLEDGNKVEVENPMYFAFQTVPVEEI